MSLDQGGLGEGQLPVAGGVGVGGRTKAALYFLCSSLTDRMASRVPGLHPWMGLLGQAVCPAEPADGCSALGSVPSPSSAAW